MSTNPARDQLHADLVEAIRNEANAFDMRYYTTTQRDFQPAIARVPEAVATCDTALCMAGHLEAVRPELAAELAPNYSYAGGHVSHSQLASAIYERVTGERCPLDFYGINTTKDLDNLTREDAVLHILGEHDAWPLHDVSDEDG